MLIIFRKKYKRQIQLVKKLEKLYEQKGQLDHYIGVEKSEDPILVMEWKLLIKKIDKLEYELIINAIN